MDVQWLEHSLCPLPSAYGETFAVKLPCFTLKCQFFSFNFSLLPSLIYVQSFIAPFSSLVITSLFNFIHPPPSSVPDMMDHFCSISVSLDLFQKLFRQDLLVASLFRNFLLAERIMRSYNCTPVSSPRLPPTYMHAMW